VTSSIAAYRCDYSFWVYFELLPLLYFYSHYFSS